ncbi:MAG: hypothetical protein WCG85_23570 [Polyangia bacterium]
MSQSCTEGGGLDGIVVAVVNLSPAIWSTAGGVPPATNVQFPEPVSVVAPVPPAPANPPRPVVPPVAVVPPTGGVLPAKMRPPDPLASVDVAPPVAPPAPVVVRLPPLSVALAPVLIAPPVPPDPRGASGGPASSTAPAAPSLRGFAVPRGGAEAPQPKASTPSANGLHNRFKLRWLAFMAAHLGGE